MVVNRGCWVCHTMLYCSFIELQCDFTANCTEFYMKVSGVWGLQALGCTVAGEGYKTAVWGIWTTGLRLRD